MQRFFLLLVVDALLDVGCVALSCCFCSNKTMGHLCSCSMGYIGGLIYFVWGFWAGNKTSSITVVDDDGH